MRLLDYINKHSAIKNLIVLKLNYKNNFKPSRPYLINKKVKMAEEQMQRAPQDPTTALLSEFGTRLNEMEEKQRLIKDRVLLIGENLISTKEEIEQESSKFKKQISQIDFELKAIKQLTKRIVNELQNFARKSEVEILARQLKMFEPLEFARIKDVENMIRKQKDIKKKKT